MSEEKIQENKGKKVLLVEDDPLIIRMYQNKLSNDGYSVTTAINGQEGLAEVAKDKPDLILLDVMMPKMNGVETLKALKKNSDTKDIGVIILTNLGDKPEDVDKAKGLGALDYLVKSQISLEELSARVHKAIAEGR